MVGYTYDEIEEMVIKEFNKATMRYGPFKNAHEGYAILLEEFDELWDNVKIKQDSPKRDELMRKEAVQVAAMAIRIIRDCIPKEE